MRLLQLVPRVAPEQEGVSGFAAALGDALRAEAGCDSIISVPELASPSGLRIFGDASAEPAAVLLHYVGYGYQARGVPRQLARAWESAQIEARRRGVRFGVMFHEVVAFGPPWRSSFWLHPQQRRVARRILGAADTVITSLERYRHLLGSLEPTKDVEVIGVPSTIGEPPTVSDFERREPRLVVFGSSGVRRRTWEAHREDVAAAARALDVGEIVDVGAEAGAPESLEGRRVVRLGVTPAPEISDLLGRSRAGFLAYPPDYLGKSTVYAAYAAHGVVPVCTWRGWQVRRVRPAEPWMTPHARVDPKSVASLAGAHYATRNLARHAAAWRRLLEPR
jgi:hypothetical protein